ncbi:hypothetical protein KPL74_05010 [Bacillus sp. NP157]|nr:hypothetical protein KPL74_05010 [Bacillus sp. NP157]
MPAIFRSKVAIIVEPRPDLAATVAECLRMRHYVVVVATTHAGGAELALAQARVDFLVAAVPAPGESRVGAYLAVAREENPGMGVVVMLADPYESLEGTPEGVVKIIKPFSVAELEAALDRAGATDPA